MADRSAVQHALSELILDQGEEICLDQRKVATLLERQFPGRPATCVAAHVAVREGVAADLAQDASPQVPAMVFDRLVHRLTDHAGLDFSHAVWATRAWAAALQRSCPEEPPSATVQPLQRRIAQQVPNQPGKRAHTLKGHRKALSCVRFSPTGSHLATGSLDRTLRIWESRSGRQKALLLGGHREWVRGVAWSPDGEGLASVGDDGAIRLWKPKTQERMYRLAGHRGAALCVDFSPDGQWVASGGVDGQVCLWRVEGLELVQVFEHTEPILGLRIAESGLAVASVGEVMVLEIPTLRRRIRVTTAGSSCVDLGAGGRMVIGDEGGLRSWDTRTDTQRLEYQGHQGAVRAVVLHPNHRGLASAGVDKTVRVWSLDQPKELWRFETGRRVTALDQHPMGHLAFGFGNGQAQVREMVFAAPAPVEAE